MSVEHMAEASLCAYSMARTCCISCSSVPLDTGLSTTAGGADSVRASSVLVTRDSFFPCRVRDVGGYGLEPVEGDAPAVALTAGDAHAAGFDVLGGAGGLQDAGTGEIVARLGEFEIVSGPEEFDRHVLRYSGDLVGVDVRVQL